MCRAMMREMNLRRDYLQGPFTTAYFGGGTPSVLPSGDLERLLDTARSVRGVLPDAEITVEANPDDLTVPFVRDLLRAGVNRLSIGIQSFFDDELRRLNRSHNAEQADRAVKLAQDTGIANLTIDLMYALPGSGDDRWQRTLDRAVGLDVPHISAYCLTIEQHTVFGRWSASGRLRPEDDGTMERQYGMLCRSLADAGYVHYEVSNFARPGMESRHNSAYWDGQEYMGIGPSAHSYDGRSRQWNVRNNQVYMRSVETGAAFWEREEIDETDAFNEYLITRLRTAAGLDLTRLAEWTDEWFWEGHGSETERWRDLGWLRESEGRFALSEKGMLMADQVTTALMKSR
jgi:oxygen-independent coproporphyrinogen III oxidase